ncbi:MAG: alginate lyase family protein [Pyrinomonadaceae bacterium]|nr:alginate lyase family protein [Pyrinomonadaceae bacterium]
MSASELSGRSAQKAAAFAERWGWSSLSKLPSDQTLFAMSDLSSRGIVPSAQGFLECFRSRSTPNFFAGFADKDATVLELRKRWPSAESEIVERANRLVAGRFDLLGLRDISFGDPIDWHLEPMSGKRAPHVHWSKLDYLDAELAGDKKIIWELNRQQYFATLGQAYWLTNDERYAETFVAHLDSWMDQNAPKVGINWASSLEVAFRSISWLWGFYFFKDSPSLKAGTFLRAMKFLYLHARHLETYLSTYFSPNTHLTGETLGLFYLGLFLPEFSDAWRWKEKGTSILMQQLSRHVRPDGVYFEQSSYYHRYTTDFYTHFLILSQKNGEQRPSDVPLKLQALLDHLMYITRPDGTTPFFGDDDGGRLDPLDRRPVNDFRASLSTGAALFNRADYKFVAAEKAEQTLWLLGPEALQNLDDLEATPPARQSAAFKDSGYYIMRDGWGPAANFLLFDCGPHGEISCGHAHADALSFELAPGGRTMLVDPGTYTYTGSKEMRDWFRSSVAHNTLTIDGESSSVPDGPFSWLSVAQCTTASWISTNRFDYVEGGHDGYSRLASPAAHSRSILFLKKNYWVVRDRVSADMEHRVDLWFHFDSNAAPLIEALEGQIGNLVEHEGGTGLGIVTFADQGRWRREDGWVSHCYGERAPARVYSFSTLINGNNELLTFLLPRTDASEPGRVREIEAIGGKAFELTHENGVDIVMIRQGEVGQRVEMERLASDFDWTWARFADGREPIPQGLVLIGGQWLQLDGREIIKLERRIEYLAASQLGHQFRVETDAGTVNLDLPLNDLESLFAVTKRPGDLD